jgi:propionate CoA-transferase
MNYQDLFNWYHGGGLDIAFLGFGQVDKEGNVNLTKFGDDFRGLGGGMDLGVESKKAVFMGTFTRGGLRAEVGGGKIFITEEGRTKKFINHVEQITISGKFLSQQKGKEVMYVTERAVFKLGERGPILIEIAPGVDLDRDILANMEFRPEIASNLKQMESRLFREESIGLREELQGYDEPGRIPCVPMIPAEELRRAAYWGRSHGGARSIGLLRKKKQS